MPDSSRFPVRLSDESREALREAAKEWKMRETDIVREALELYFRARGKKVEFTSQGWGGNKRK